MFSKKRELYQATEKRGKGASKESARQKPARAHPCGGGGGYTVLP